MIKQEYNLSKKTIQNYQEIKSLNLTKNKSTSQDSQSNNLLQNYLFQYLQLDYSQIPKQSQKAQNIIKQEIKKIIQKSYQDFLQKWNNKKQYVWFEINNYNLTCLYNNNQSKQFIAQFICCTKGCLKRGVICGNKKCQCQQDHIKCKIISIQTFIENLQLKVRKPPNQTFYTYIQGKKIMLNFLVNRISKQIQITQEWQNTLLDITKQTSQNVTEEKKSVNKYFLCDFNGKIKNCKKIKVGDMKNTSECLKNYKQYELIQFKDKEQRESKYGNLIKIIKKTHNLITDSFLKQIEKVQQAEIRSCYLNYAQYQTLKHFMASNGFIDSATSLEEITGNLVFIGKNLSLKHYIKKAQETSQMKKQKNPNYYACQSQKQQFKFESLQQLKYKQQQVHLKMGFDENLVVFIRQSCQSSSFDKNTLMDLKNKWNQKCSKIFYRQIEGVVFQFEQLMKEKFNVPLFSNNNNLPNLIQSRLQQIFLRLQGKEIYKEKKYQSLQVPSGFINQDILKPFSKIHLQTNLEKLQKDIRREIGLKILQDILQKFNGNRLKNLNLYLYGIEKFHNGFIQNLCEKFPQIKEFHHSFFSNSQYLYKHYQDRGFIPSVSQQFQLSIQQCLQLSNLKHLQNIFISQIDDQRSADIIKNMKKQLKHVSLYNCDRQRKRICKQLFQQLLEIKSQLITLTLSFFQINQDDIKNIMKIIENNPNIQTLVLSQLMFISKYIKSQFFQCIGKNLKNLKILIIQNGRFNNNNKIQQKDFQMLDQCSSSLKLLNLSCFNKIDKQCFKKTIQKMKNITHLILMFNDFIDDDVMQTIGSSLQKLEVISLLESNNVTGKGLLKLQNLKYLNTLMFYENTKIKGKDMIQLSKQVKTIKKLSLFKMITVQNRKIFKAQQLIEIDLNLNQGITHLGIQKCQKVGLNCIMNLKSLKVLFISKYHFSKQQRQILQMYIKQEGIALYQTKR